MTTNRLEAFSDGVLAIVITIMVLEMKAPEGASLEDLKPVIPKFISYILSFIYIGIYWNNHHHLFQATQKVNGKVLWVNLFLLFSLSLIPFTTAWMGENNFEAIPVAFYGLSLIFCAISFVLLESVAIKHDGKESIIGTALVSKKKEFVSLGLYLIGILLSFTFPIASLISYFIVALLWLVPDKRIENKLEKQV